MGQMVEGVQERRLLTTDDVVRMVEVGILDEDERVELLEGQLFEMTRQGPEHAALTVVLRDHLVQAYVSPAHIRDHTSLPLDRYNLPEPDITVVRGVARQYIRRHPAPDEVVLIAEVAMTSHARDRLKATLYARAGLAEYWILDIPARTLTVHREPIGDRYATVDILGEAEMVTPPGTQARIRVHDLLP